MYGAIYYGEAATGSNVSYVPYTYVPASGQLKPLGSWIEQEKKPTLFRRIVSVGMPYMYDDATIPYDSPMYFYDYKAGSNQLNDLNPTAWRYD